MPSDTPLTDAQLLKIENGHSYANKPDSEEMITEIVSAEFARELERKVKALQRNVIDLLEETSDNDRWIREVLVDFAIPFDDHKVGRRIALTQWMVEQGRGD